MYESIEDRVQRKELGLLSQEEECVLEKDMEEVAKDAHSNYKWLWPLIVISISILCFVALNYRQLWKVLLDFSPASLLLLVFPLFILHTILMMLSHQDYRKYEKRLVTL